MYIKKYWGNFIGGSDDSLNLVAFLEDQKQEAVSYTHLDVYKRQEELWLGEDTEQLLFQNKGPDDCTIHAPEDGSALTLQFIGEYRPHTELPNLWGLHGIQLKDFDLTALVDAHPHLKELRL